jgi:hypothetical protein
MHVDLLRNNAQVFFQAWTFLAIAVLLIVWPIPHTIAARNIAIYSGLASAIGWFVLTRPRLYLLQLWPVLCLLAVPAWVLLHWFFISNLQELQWKELSSTWLRAAALVILGAISGIMLLRSPRFILWVVFPISVLPFISLWLNLEKSVAQHTFILSEPLYGVYKAKFLEVYFVLLQVLIGFAFMHFAALNANNKHTIKLFLIGFSMVCVGIINFYYAHALNGVLMFFFGALVLCLSIIYNYKKFIYNLNQKKQKIFLSTILIIAFCIIFLLISNYSLIDNNSGGKLKNLISDIKFTISEYSHNNAWAADKQVAIYPVDAAGRHINGSTYERVSWFLKGAQIIAKEPLGNGISHQAFGHYMRVEYPGSLLLMTHSAWIDFTLGLGLPALTLMWLVVFGIVYSGYLRMKSLEMQDFIHYQSTNFPYEQLISRISTWLVAGMFIFWIIGEVSERIFIENYFFFLAFFSMTIGRPNSDC